MKAYAVFENATNNSFKNTTEDEFENKWHLHHSIPTLVWHDSSGGIVTWRKETNRLSHFILFATKEGAEEHMFERQDEAPGDYIIKEVEITIKD